MSLFIKKFRSIKFKVIGTLVLTLIVLILGYFVSIKIFNKKNELIQIVQKQELKESINAILLTKNDSYGKMVFDYSVFSWMIDFIKHPSKKEGELTISHPQNVGIDFIQIYNLDEKLVYFDLDKDIDETVNIAHEAFDTLYRIRKINFFLKTKYGLMQVFGSTVHNSEDIDQKTKPNGFVFFGKLWDKGYLNTLKKITNCSIELKFDSDVLKNQSGDIEKIFFNDYDSKKVAYIAISKVNPFIDNIRLLNTYFNIFFLTFCLVLLIIIYRNFNTLVISPLQKIELALNVEQTNIITNLTKRKDEFGKIALLIRSFFEQKDELKITIDELNATQLSLRDLNEELTEQKKEIEGQNKFLQFLNKEMQTQNDEIIATAEVLQLANREITDSINYASFIQNAVLAPSSELSKIFSEHFIFYMPKNIVSGDFYWFKEMKNGERVFAVADCTGHGLSGSLLSMLGISYLNQIMSQVDGEEYTAGTILDSLKSFFIQSLHQGGEIDYVQDGMHIALCIFDKNCRSMQYATAFHTICLVRKNTETGTPEMTEYKGNRIPVGIYITDEQFVNYTVDLKKGDLIYMYSDGYPDQFGGPFDKKFMPNKLRNILLTNSQMHLVEQKEQIIREFESWKGINDQTDDVLVVGIKIPDRI